MKKQIKKTIATLALVAIVLSVVGLSLLAKAATYEFADTVITNDVYEDDLYVFGGNVVVDQDVNGDLIVFGGNVEVSSKIAGDVFIAGGKVVLQGEVGDDVRVVGGWLSLNGLVGDDLIAAGGTITVSSGSIIQGDCLVSSGNLNFSGVVSGSVKFVAASIIFSGEVVGDAVLISESSLKIADRAKIGGNLEYRSSKPIEVADSVVGGEVIFKEITALDFTKQETEPTIGTVTVGTVFMQIWSFLTLLVIGIVLMLAVPYSFRNTTEIVTKSYWKSLALGLVFLIVVPITAVLLMFTLVGFKLALVLCMIVGVEWLIAKLYAGYVLGSFILKPKTKTASFWPEFWRLTIGFVILFVIGMIPLVGTFTSWIVTFAALGGLLIYKFNVFNELRKKKLA